MSDIKVLALELDGTQTNDQKLVTPRTRAALFELSPDGGTDHSAMASDKNALFTHAYDSSAIATS